MFRSHHRCTCPCTVALLFHPRALASSGFVSHTQTNLTDFQTIGASVYLSTASPGSARRQLPNLCGSTTLPTDRLGAEGFRRMVPIKHWKEANRKEEKKKQQAPKLLQFLPQHRRGSVMRGKIFTTQSLRRHSNAAL